MSRRLRLLPLLSSVLYILAFPNFNLSGLAWVALVPLSLDAKCNFPKQAFLSGWLSGTIAYTGLLYWIIVTFNSAHLSIVLSIFCLLLLAGYLGLYWGTWAAFVSYIAQGKSWNIAPLLGAAAWVALEYLRTYLFSGFPWVLLADSQVKNLPLIQIASLTGVYGVSFLFVMVNLAISDWKWKSLCVTLGLVLLNGLYGHTRLNAHEPTASIPIQVALLQGNIDQYKKWDSAYVAEIQRTYENLILKASASHPDLILWPETSMPGYFQKNGALDTWLRPLVKRSHARHIIGTPVQDASYAYNAALSLDNEGDVDGAYAKKHLVPFGEKVPWAGVLGKFIPVLNELGGFNAGHQSPVLPMTAEISVGVNICYEAIFPNLVRQSVKEGATLIANMTNDGWYMHTSEPYQHWAPSIYRAIENDRWLLRADNTGISGIIDPKGRVIAQSTIFEPTVVIGTIETRTRQTPYTRWGDVFAWICCFASIGGCWWKKRN